MNVRRAEGGTAHPPVAPQPVGIARVAFGVVFGAAVLAVALGYAFFQVGMGAFTIPGLGMLVSAGPLTALEYGVGAGAALGALVGGALTYGIARRSAVAAARALDQAELVVSVHTEDAHQVDVARQAFGAHRASMISVRAEGVVATVAPVETPSIAPTAMVPTPVALENTRVEHEQLPN